MDEIWESSSCESIRWTGCALCHCKEAFLYISSKVLDVTPDLGHEPLMISEGRNALTHALWEIFGTSTSMPLISMSKLKRTGFFLNSFYLNWSPILKQQILWFSYETISPWGARMWRVARKYVCVQQQGWRSSWTCWLWGTIRDLFSSSSCSLLWVSQAKAVAAENPDKAVWVCLLLCWLLW